MEKWKNAQWKNSRVKKAHRDFDRRIQFHINHSFCFVCLTRHHVCVCCFLGVFSWVFSPRWEQIDSYDSWNYMLQESHHMELQIETQNASSWAFLKWNSFVLMVRWCLYSDTLCIMSYKNWNCPQNIINLLKNKYPNLIECFCIQRYSGIGSLQSFDTANIRFTAFAAALNFFSDYIRLSKFNIQFKNYDFKKFKNPEFKS